MKHHLTTALTLLVSCMMAAAEWQPLWPGDAPGVAKSATKGGYPTNAADPAYEVHLPAGEKTGAAVVVFPGGGYTTLAMGHEGKDYARWLNERGIVAVVVKYRVSGDDGAGFHYPVPLLDARRAIRTTRFHAKEWGVDPAKVGVMGSSAGGHLASMCATLSEERFKEEGTDEIDRQECRPDFAVLVYPVITMTEKWGHQGSKRRLLGESPAVGLAGKVSTELRVNAKTPPCFLVHAADDGVVPVRNSLEFAARCAENKLPVVCHVYAQGGHGFGLKGRGDSAEWSRQLELWLAGMKLMKQNAQP